MPGWVWKPRGQFEQTKEYILQMRVFQKNTAKYSEMVEATQKKLVESAKRHAPERIMRKLADLALLNKLALLQYQINFVETRLAKEAGILFQSYGELLRVLERRARERGVG